MIFFFSTQKNVFLLLVHRLEGNERDEPLLQTPRVNDAKT